MKIKKNLLILLADLIVSFLGTFITFAFAYGSSYGGMFIGGVITAGLTIVTMELVEDYVD